MASVLVTDGESRAALAIVRSLGGRGHRVFVCSPRRRCLAGASRYCHAQGAVPDPLGAGSRFAEAVEGLLRLWKIEVLLPVSEAALLALLPVREHFPGVAVPFPQDAVFRRVSDKAAVMDAATALGIAVPSEHRLASSAAFSSLRPADVTFPLVVKPARSVVEVLGEERGGSLKLGVQYASDWPTLRAVLDAVPAAAYPVLLQQRVEGLGTGVFVLLGEDDAVVARFAHRRLREKPPAGGVSVYAESIAAPEPLVEASVRLLRRFGWSGLAMVEYKVDSVTGRPYLMEINGRFWGSLQLAVDAGVDFPGLLVRLALGERPVPVMDYRVGTRLRWWWGDVDHLLTRMRHSRASLSLGPNAPGRWRVLRDFVRAGAESSRNEVLRRDDPCPFLHETLDWLRGR
jgi:ATP-grasp domain-containing protein